MFSTILLRRIFKKSAAAAVNENVFCLCVPAVYVMDSKERHYARWSARHPSKQLLPDDNKTTEQEHLKKQEKPVTHSQSSSKMVNKKHPPLKPVHSFENREYMVLDKEDYTFSNLMIQASNRNNRKKNRLIILEGKRLIKDALLAGLAPVNVFFTQKSYLSELNFVDPEIKIPLYKIPYPSMKLWSKLEAPPGVIGFFNIPRKGDIKPVDSMPVQVLCDNIRDPGNLGSILRVAASAGCTQVLLMKGCTDPWDSKVLRSASGGHFHIPIEMDLTWEELEGLLHPDAAVYLADNNCDRILPSQKHVSQTLYYDADYINSKSIVVIIGGETEGVSDEALSLASKQDGSRIYIPLSNSMESLNSGCALSILLFEIKRQLLLNQGSLIASISSQAKECG